MKSDKSNARGLLAGALSVAIIGIGIVLWQKSIQASTVTGATAAAAPAASPVEEHSPAAAPAEPPAGGQVLKPVPPDAPRPVAIDAPKPAGKDRGAGEAAKPAAKAPGAGDAAKQVAAAVAKDDPAPAAGSLGGLDHPMFGGTPSRNMVNLVAKGIIDKPNPDGPDLLWKADLGSRAYGGPTVAGGKVFVGTNNERPRNKRDFTAAGEPIDKGVLMAFDEKSGSFLWQAVHPKLTAANVHDWPKEGLCSTAAVEGNRIYYVSNRCTVVCADANGMADGMQGHPITFTDPAAKKEVANKDNTDADVIWEYDLMGKEGVFPHNMAAGCPLVVGDLLYCVTANGVDEGHLNIPAPNAPSFIALDKKTGKVVWRSAIPGKNIMHGQWSNPCYAEIKGVKQVIFPGGDGYLYAFEPLKGGLLWKCDCNPKESVYKLGGEGTRNDFIGTPVAYKDKIYIGLGQDPEHFTGVGHFWCIDPAKATAPGDDISPELGDWGKPGKPNPKSGIVWHYGGPDTRPNVPRDFVFGRTMSTACIVDDVLYISELQGQLHCLDANTGKKFWMYDTKGAIWGSPTYADGKVFLATEGGELFVFKHHKAPKTIADPDYPKLETQKEITKAKTENRKAVEAEYLIHKQEFDAPIRSTPVIANGMLFVMTESALYAFNKK